MPTLTSSLFEAASLRVCSCLIPLWFSDEDVRAVRSSLFKFWVLPNALYINSSPDYCEWVCMRMNDPRLLKILELSFKIILHFLSVALDAEIGKCDFATGLSDTFYEMNIRKQKASVRSYSLHLSTTFLATVNFMSHHWNLQADTMKKLSKNMVLTYLYLFFFVFFALLLFGLLAQGCSSCRCFFLTWPSTSQHSACVFSFTSPSKAC